jgi:hypothetical protein
VVHNPVALDNIPAPDGILKLEHIVVFAYANIALDYILVDDVAWIQGDEYF